VRETAKVTHAMEIVAGARMRRTEARAVESRPYATYLSHLIGALLGYVESEPTSRLLVSRDPSAVLIIHMTTDKGLCGSLNSRINQSLAAYAVNHIHQVRVATVGRKGRDFVLRSGLELVADFSGLPEAPSMAELMPVCRLAIDMFTSETAGAVYLSYPVFVSTMAQQPVIEQLLPVDTSRTRAHAGANFVIEPDPGALLEALLVRYVEASVYRAYLELVASEYSARMVAMHSATDSAHELSEDLTLELNKVRQAAVTSEMSDVSAGAEALRTGGSGG